MSSPVIFSLTAAQRDYLAAFHANPATWPTFNKRIGLALAKSGLLAFNGKRPYLTITGEAASRLAHILVKASPAVVSNAVNPASREGQGTSAAPDPLKRGSAVTSV